MSYQVRGARVTWRYAGRAASDTASADTTFEGPAFLDESEMLLLQATPSLYASPAGVRLPMMAVDQDVLHRFPRVAHLVDSVDVMVPGRGTRRAWVIVVGDNPNLKIDGRKYWIDRETHEVLMWLEPEDSEAEQCPIRYTRTR